MGRSQQRRLQEPFPSSWVLLWQVKGEMVGSWNPLQQAVPSHPHTRTMPAVRDASWSCQGMTTEDRGSQPCPADGLRQGCLQSKTWELLGLPGLES